MLAARLCKQQSAYLAVHIRRKVAPSLLQVAVRQVAARQFSAASLGMFGDGEGKKPRAPLEIYDYLTRKERLREDPHQREVIKELTEVYNTLSKYDPSPYANANVDSAPTKKSSGNGAMSFVSSFFGSSSKPAPAKKSELAVSGVDPNIPKGLYMWGDPGCGKTMLMDLLFRCVTNIKKKRTHFNSFMLDVHRRIFEHKTKTGNGDAIPAVIDQLAKEAQLLCFDEFQVTDVADAMVIKRLFSGLFARGVIVVATSNRAPEDLYQNGIQREVFVPFIHQLKDQTKVLKLHSGLDYRTMGTYLEDTYFTPVNSANKQLLESAWERTLDGATPEPREVEVQFGRHLKVPLAGNGVARFRFPELCMTNLGPSDYMGLAKHFHTVFITDVPKFTDNDLNAINRFIKCIDELYQGRVRTVISAAAEPEKLFENGGQFEETFAFSRCSSRLREMQSKEYLNSSKSNQLLDL